MIICVRKHEYYDSDHKELEPCCTLIYRYMTKDEIEADQTRAELHLRVHREKALAHYETE